MTCERKAQKEKAAEAASNSFIIVIILSTFSISTVNAESRIM